MYAGQTVEGGPSEEVIQRPKHPYTQLLISAAPDPDRLTTASQNRAEASARGEIPSLINPPSGCRFHPRCPVAMPICSQRFPKRTDLGGGHWTHCFLYGDGDAKAVDSDSTLVTVTPSSARSVEKSSPGSSVSKGDERQVQEGTTGEHVSNRHTAN